MLDRLRHRHPRHVAITPFTAALRVYHADVHMSIAQNAVRSAPHQAHPSSALYDRSLYGSSSSGHTRYTICLLIFIDLLMLRRFAAHNILTVAAGRRRKDAERSAGECFTARLLAITRRRFRVVDHACHCRRDEGGTNFQPLYISLLTL